MGSGCSSVGRAVASDSRSLQFESSHRQQMNRKVENKEKAAGIGPFSEKNGGRFKAMSLIDVSM